MAEARPLAVLGHARWRLMAGPIAAIAVSGPLATQYGLLAIDFPGKLAAVFVVAVGGVTIPLISMLVLVRTLRLTPSVIALQKGAAPKSALLLQALRELDQQPARLFGHTVQHFALAGLLVDTTLALFSREASAALLLRLLALALLLSPMLGFLTAFAASVATRPLFRRIAALGLTPRQVYDAIPPRNQRLRRWIVLTTSTYALTTAVMALDAASHTADRDMQQLLAERDPARQQALARQLATKPLWPVILLSAFGAGIGVATALVVGKSLADPMREIAAQAGRISKGELAAPTLIPADEEVWRLSSTFATIQEQLRDALAQLQTAGLRLGSSSTQLVETFARQEEGATEQASALNETSATTEELARSAGQIAENAGEVEKMAERTLSAAQLGQKSAEAFFQSMLRMRTDNQRVADAVVKLNKRVAQIGRIVEFIDGIADKSDLLALNAELEGTKAGEVGRGFSLVAAEMRRLAENVMRSTREIERLIQEIRDATNAAVMATEAGVKATERGTSSANEVLESLRQIFELARETADSVRQISLATHQQQAGTHQLADAMSEILRITEASSVATGQMRSANVDLTTLASDLGKAVLQFTVTRQEPHGS